LGAGVQDVKAVLSIKVWAQEEHFLFTYLPKLS